MEHHGLVSGEILGDLLCRQGQVVLREDVHNEVSDGHHVVDGTHPSITTSVGVQQICL